MAKRQGGVWQRKSAGLMAARKQEGGEKKMQRTETLQGLPASDLPPPVLPHLPMVTTQYISPFK